MYHELLKLKKHYERARGDRAMLHLIHKLTLATRGRIAAVAIQRAFRASLRDEEIFSALTILYNAHGDAVRWRGGSLRVTLPGCTRVPGYEG